MNEGPFPHVTSYSDRHGKLRWRFRKTGVAPHNFRSDYGTRAFEQEYDWMLRERGLRAGTTGKGQTVDGLQIVYVVGAATGPVKIGWTKNFDSRLIRLQTGHPRPLKLLAALPGDKTVEAALHKQFKAYRLHGEWFRKSPEVRAFIKANEIGPWRTDLWRPV